MGEWMGGWMGGREIASFQTGFCIFVRPEHVILARIRSRVIVVDAIRWTMSVPLCWLHRLGKLSVEEVGC